jgi:hypothetical protein
MQNDAIEKVRALETAVADMPQSQIDTDHVLHGGQYTRTILVPAGVMITGALIKIATTLVICGDCWVYIGDAVIRVNGYQVLAASAGRKQAFIANQDTYITMSFATDATSIEEAEDAFSDESHLLLSRSHVARNTFTITGE